MKKTTLLGYMGGKGESPDALDAFTWGVFALANIGNLQDENSFFNMDNFSTDLKDYGFRNATLRFAYRNKNEMIYIEAEILENATLRRAINIKKCLPLKEMPKDDGLPIMLQDDEANWSYSNAYLYDEDNTKLNDKAENILNYSKRTGTAINVSECETAIFENMNENLVETTLRKFKIDDKKSDTILEAIYYLLQNIA